MAEYVETLLAPGETIVTNARQHWAALIRFALTPIAILALGFLGLVVGAWLGSWAAFQGVASILDWAVGLATGLAFVVAVVWLPIQFIRWGSRRFVLTSRRVLTTDGWLRKSTSDASLDKITDVSYEQSFFGARLGFGDLTIETASNTPLPMRELRDAIEFKKAIMVQQDALVKERASHLLAAQQGQVPGMAPIAAAAPVVAAAVEAAPVAPPPPVVRAETPAEITATLASLTDMKEAGTISEADFEAKKKELLDRL
jgi:membrane protein YdbS with pleckstrin-like domain